MTPASERTVEAYLTYTVDTGIKPVTGTTGPDGKPRHRSGEFREHLMTVRDARPCRESLSLNGRALSWSITRHRHRIFMTRGNRSRCTTRRLNTARRMRLLLEILF